MHGLRQGKKVHSTKPNLNNGAYAKSRKKALIAISRKLLTVVWHVLEEKSPYNPKIVPVYNPEKIKQKMKYFQRELDKLQALGYSLT